MFITLSCLVLAGTGLRYLRSGCVEEEGLLLASLVYGSWHNTVLPFTQDFAVMP